MQHSNGAAYPGGENILKCSVYATAGCDPDTAEAHKMRSPFVPEATPRPKDTLRIRIYSVSANIFTDN